MLTQVFTPEAAQAANIALIPQKSEGQFIRDWEPQVSTGSVTRRFFAENPQGTLVHIQDAHAVFEAQKNIETLLTEIKEIAPAQEVFLEGGVGELDPKLRHFFPEGLSLTQPERDHWMKEGHLTGAEAYLMTNGAARGYGIEEIKSYWDNVDLYRRVDAARSDSAAFNEILYAAWQKEAVRKFKPAFKKYLEIYAKAQIDAASSANWFDALRDYLKVEWNRDLNSMEEQIELPMLTRYIYLKTMDVAPDYFKVEKQKQEFFASVRAKAGRNAIDEKLFSEINALIEKFKSNQIDLSGAREVFEQLAVYLPDDFSMASWPDLKALIEKMILAGEMDADELLKEARGLHIQIIKKDARLKAQRALVLLLEKQILLTNLLSLKLTRDDFQKILKYSSRPKMLISELRAISSGRSLVGAQEMNVLEEAYDNAIRFYRGAIEREDAMQRGILEKTKKGKVAVVVTGGFHAEGMQSFAREQNWNYVAVTPRISKIQPEDFAHYRRALLGEGSALGEAGMPSEVAAALLTSAGVFEDLRAGGREQAVMDLPGAAQALQRSSQHTSLRWKRNSPKMKRSAIRPSGPSEYLADWAGAARPSRRSESRITTVLTQDLSPADELELLIDVRERLKNESERLGSGGLPEIVYISDEHGAIDKFDALIIDAIRRTLPFSNLPSTFEFQVNHNRRLFDQLKAFGITPDDLKGKLYFQELGDPMDRGPDGVAVWERAKELVEVGLSGEITGNHNLMVFLNLAGIHLPFYEGYNFYDYSDAYDSTDGKIQELVRQFHSQNSKDAKNKTWWAERLAQFMEYHQDRQKKIWSRLEDEINGPKNQEGKRDVSRALYMPVLADLPADSAEKELWDQLRGWYLVDVYTGVRGVGGMSLVWWENLLKDFEIAHAELLDREELNPGSPSDKAWRRAIAMMKEEIIPEYKRDLENQLREGKWWWRAFEALNSQNYTSVEWYAKDWIFHKGWGTSVLEELNRNRGDLPEITPANYLDNPILKEIAERSKAKFNLFLKDIYQQTSLHAFLPVNNLGEFYFTYKGIEYRGKGKAGDDGYPSIWEGLKLIQDDVRNPGHTFLDMYEALSLVMSWYADNTTKAKPGELIRVLNRFGPEHLAEMNGYNVLFTGHIPFQQFTKIPAEKRGVVTSYNVGGRNIFTDHDMSPAYKYRGMGIWTGPASGILPRGFEHEGNRLIDIKNEPRMIDLDSDGNEIEHFHHRAVPRDFFIAGALRNIDDRIAELKENLGRSEIRDALAAARSEARAFSLSPTASSGIRLLLAGIFFVPAFAFLYGILGDSGFRFALGWGGAAAVIAVFAKAGADFWKDFQKQKPQFSLVSDAVRNEVWSVLDRWPQPAVKTWIEKEDSAAIPDLSKIRDHYVLGAIHFKIAAGYFRAGVDAGFSAAEIAKEIRFDLKIARDQFQRVDYDRDAGVLLNALNRLELDSPEVSPALIHFVEYFILARLRAQPRKAWADAPLPSGGYVLGDEPANTDLKNYPLPSKKQTVIFLLPGEDKTTFKAKPLYRDLRKNKNKIQFIQLTPQDYASREALTAKLRSVSEKRSFDILITPFAGLMPEQQSRYPAELQRYFEDAKDLYELQAARSVDQIFYETDLIPTLANYFVQSDEQVIRLSSRSLREGHVTQEYRTPYSIITMLMAFVAGTLGFKKGILEATEKPLLADAFYRTGIYGDERPQQPNEPSKLRRIFLVSPHPDDDVIAAKAVLADAMKSAQDGEVVAEVIVMQAGENGVTDLDEAQIRDALRFALGYQSGKLDAETIRGLKQEWNKTFNDIRTLHKNVLRDMRERDAAVAAKFQAKLETFKGVDFEALFNRAAMLAWSKEELAEAGILKQNLSEADQTLLKETAKYFIRRVENQRAIDFFNDAYPGKIRAKFFPEFLGYPSSGPQDLRSIHELEEHAAVVMQHLLMKFERSIEDAPKDAVLTVVGPSGTDAHAHHVGAYRVLLAAMRLWASQASRQSKRDVEVLYYFAPWSGNLPAYHLSPQTKKSSNADLLRALIAGELTAARFGLPSPKELQNMQAQRYLVRPSILSARSEMRTHKVTIQTLQEMKSRGEPITMLTAYDKNDAALLEDGEVDITFVGDSGGMVRLGFPSTQEVTMDHMVSFALDAKENVRQSLFVVDMPHLSYRNEEEALVNARRLMDAGAETVKLEGGEEVALIVNHLVANGIPVMGHIAYTPQSKGDHKSVGRTEEEARQLLKDAMAIQKAGAYAVVIELADSEVSAWISKRLKIPTIGIGAGIGTDGQVLVIDDLLGKTKEKWKQLRPDKPGVKTYGVPKMVGEEHWNWDAQSGDLAIVQSFVAKVKSRQFPAEQNSFHPYNGKPLDEVLTPLMARSEMRKDLPTNDGSGKKFTARDWISGWFAPWTLKNEEMRAMQARIEKVSQHVKKEGGLLVIASTLMHMLILILGVLSKTIALGDFSGILVMAGTVIYALSMQTVNTLTKEALRLRDKTSQGPYLWTDFPYSRTQNPVYLGYILGTALIVIAVPSFFGVLNLTVLTVWSIARIIYERVELWNETEEQALKEAKKKTKNRKITQRQKLQRQIEEVPVFLPGTKWLERIVEQAVTRRRSEQRSHAELENFLENAATIAWPDKEPFQAAYKHAFERLRNHLNKIKTGDGPIQFNFTEEPRVMDSLAYWQSRIRSIQEDVKTTSEAEDFWLEALTFEYELMLRVQVVEWRGEENLDEWIQYLSGWSDALDRLTAELIKQGRFTKFQEFAKTRYVSFEGLYESKEEKIDSEMLELIFDEALTDIPGLDESSLTFDFQKQMKDRSASDKAAMPDIEKVRWLEQFKNRMAYEMLFKPKLAPVLAEPASRLLANWRDLYSDRWNPFWESTYSGILSSVSKNQDQIKRRLGIAAIHPPARSEARSFEELNISALPLSSSLRSKANLIFPAVNVKTMGDLRGVPDQVLREAKSSTGQFSFTHEEILAVRAAVINFERAYQNQQEQQKILHAQESQDRQEKFVNRTRIKELRSRILSQKFDMGVYLAYLMLKPAGETWAQYLDGMPDFTGTKGKVDKYGLVKFSVFTGRQFVWRVLGFSDNQEREIEIIEARILSDNLFEFKVLMTVSGSEPIERIFQIGPHKEKLAKTSGHEGRERWVLKISDQLGLAVYDDEINALRSLAELVSNPVILVSPQKVNWTKILPKILSLKGVRLGETNANGVLNFTPAAGHQFVWSILGFSEKGWRAQIQDVFVDQGNLKVAILLENAQTKKSRKKTLQKVFQVGPSTRKVSHGEGLPESVSYLDLSERVALRDPGEDEHDLSTLKGLIRHLDFVENPAAIDWEKVRAGLPQLAGQALGVTAKNGTISFRPWLGYQNIQFSMGFMGEGWVATVESAEISSFGKFEVIVRFDSPKKNGTSIYRVYQFGPITRDVNRDERVLPTEDVHVSAKKVLMPLEAPALSLSNSGQDMTLADFLANQEQKKNSKTTNWKKREKDLQVLVGQSLGLSSAGGRFDFTLFSYFSAYEWAALGFREAGWRGVISRAEVNSHGVLEISVQFKLQKGFSTKQPFHVFEKTFQVGPYVRKLVQVTASGRVPNGEERYVLNLDDSPAVKTFSDQGKKLRSLSEWLVYRPFLKDPKKINWEKQRSVMKKIEGLVIGTSTKQGVYYFNALPGYTFAWPALGFPDAGWKAVVDKFELNEFGKPELTVEFTKNGEESFKRTFQLTPYKQTLHPAKGFKDKDEVGLSLSLRPAITASSSEAEATIETAATLVDLLKLPDGFDWEKNKDQIPDLVGWRLGTTGKNGVYSLVAVANHKTVPWKAIEEEGAEGVIVEQSIREGHFYFKVRFTQGEGEAAEIFEREYEIQDTFYKLSGLGKKQGAEPVYMRKILPAVRSEMRSGAVDDASDSAVVKWLVPHLGKDAQRIHTALLSGGLRKLSDIKQKTDEQVLTAINLYAGQNPHGMDDVKKIRRAVLLARVDWIDQENNLRKQKNHELLENQNTFLFLESRRNALLENILKQKEPPENLLKDYFAYLVLKPDQISWEAYLEPLAKIQKKLRGKIGVIHQRNLINFSPLDSRKYSWMLASQKEADWFGYSAWLKDVRFGRGKLELVVEIKDENERIAKTKIFQVGPYRKKIRAVRKKAVDLLTIEENTAVAVTRDGIHDFRTLSDVITDPRLLLQGDSINWSPHRAKIKNLVGLRIAPLDDRGGTVFNPVAGFNSYSWSALGSHDAGWAGVIESAEIRDGRFVFSVSFEKKGEPVRSRQFIIRGNRRELSAYDSDAKTSVLEIEPFELAWKKSINVESETITALPQLLTQSELIDSPARIKEIAARLKIDLPRNVPLGKSDSQGGFSFVVYPGYRDFYILSGRQEPGWEGTLVEGSMNRWGYYEIRVRFDKKFGGETESFEKVFQLAPLIFQFKKDNEAESQSADYKPVLSLHPRPALEKSGAEEIRTLTDLVGYPSFVKGYKKINWNDYIEALQILVGQSIGESPANGEYQFRPSEGQTYFWRPLKLADEGWRGIISKISVSAAGILEMEIEFEKAGEKQIRKFQIGTHLKELRSASAENEASKQYALSILDRPAIQVLSELITLKPDSSGSYNWEKKEAAVHSLKGLSLGVSSRGGTYWFNPYPDFGFDWRAVGLDEEGWLGTILNSQINFAGVPEFEVEFSKEGKESFRRIFQITPFQRSLIMNERAKQRKAKERTAFEITDRAALVRDKKDPRKDLVASNLTDIIRLPINFNWRGQAEKLPVLRGLRLGKISAVGRYGLTPYEGLDSYLWQALSEKEAQEWGGAEGTIVDSEWNEKTGHFEFEVLYEKTGAGGQIQATKRKYDVLNEARYLNPKKRGRADDAVQAEKEPQPILKIRIIRSEVRGGEGVAPFLSRSEILIAKIFAAGFLPLDTLKYVLGVAPESRAGLWASLTSPEKQAKEVLFAQSILFGKQTIQTHDAFVLGTELALERGFLAAAKKVFPDVFFAVIAKDSEKADLQTWLAEQNLSDFVVVAENAQQAKAALLKKNAKAIVRGLAITASFEADTLSRDLPVMTFTSGQLDRMLSFAGVVAEAARLAQFAKAFASAA